MNALRHVFVVYEERNGWTARQRRASNLPSLEEMSYFLFGRADIDDVLEDAAPALKRSGIALDLIEVTELSRLVDLTPSERQSSLIWNITDGGGPFSGSHVPSFARLLGIKRFGNSSYNQFLSQDKFKCGVFCKQLGVPVPPTVLCEGKFVLAGSPLNTNGSLFVKPCSLDNKIGIFSDSQIDDMESALAVSVRIHDLYGDRALIQPFIPGRDLRVSFLNIDPAVGLRDAIGMYWSAERNESERPYRSYQDHLVAFLEWDSMSASTPPINARAVAAEDDSRLDRLLHGIADDIARIAGAMGLRDYFSFDFRVDESGRHWLMEVNTAPFLRNIGMRHFIRERYGLGFGDAVAAAFRNSFRAAAPEHPLAFL